MRSKTPLFLVVLVQFCFSKEKINIELKQLKSKNKSTDFESVITNQTKNNIVIFPPDYGKFMGIYNLIIIVGNDTLNVYQFLNINRMNIKYDCYPGDTIKPGQSVIKKISINTPYVKLGENKIIEIEEFMKMKIQKIALEYRMDISFDSVNSAWCQKYDQIKYRTRFIEFVKRKSFGND